MTTAIWSRVAIIVVVALIVQVAVLDDIVVLGAHPDVMVLLAAASGIVLGAPRGAMVGFVTGCVADLVVDTPFGLSALVFVIVGFCCGLIRQGAGDRATPGAEVGMCVAAGAAGTFAYALIAAIVGQPGTFDTASFAAIVVVTIGAVLLSPLVLRALFWASRDTRGTRPSAIPAGGSAAG